MAALRTQAELRAQGKVKDMATRSGQSELFDTMLDMAPDRTAEVQALAIKQARDMLCTLVPKSPDYMSYRNLWATVLSHHAVRRTEINTLCAAMKKSGELLFPDWEEGRKVPQDHYRVQRP
jgi:oligoribonuclease (3'-5' exoribonuclease)